MHATPKRPLTFLEQNVRDKNNSADTVMCICKKQYFVLIKEQY
jgi:hypothetical protein